MFFLAVVIFSLETEVYAAPKITIGTPTKVVLTSVQNGRFSLKWTKVRNASGYVVYRSTTGKNGSYKKIRTIVGGSKTAYSTTTDYKNEYRYKIVSYRKYGKKIYYAKSSAAVKLKYSYKSTSYVKITAYCACPNCNGYWSSWRNGAWATNTASGKWLYNNSSYVNKYCAATPSVGKLGDKIKMKIGNQVHVLTIVDRLGSSYGYKVDYFIPSHSNCYRFGVKYVGVQNLK